MSVRAFTSMLIIALLALTGKARTEAMLALTANAAHRIILAKYYLS